MVDAKNGVGAYEMSAIRNGAIAGVASTWTRGRGEDGQRRGALRGARPRRTSMCTRSGPARRPYATITACIPTGLLSGRGDDGGRRRLRGVAQFRGVQAAGHRPLEYPCARIPEHRGERDARWGVRTDLEDMQAAPAAEMAMKHKGLIVGIKTAHYAGPEWTPVERAVEAGTPAGIPVMVDFGKIIRSARWRSW